MNCINVTDGTAVIRFLVDPGFPGYCKQPIFIGFDISSCEAAACARASCESRTHGAASGIKPQRQFSTG